MLGTDWSGFPLAGAFVIGATAAAVAVIRLTKVIRDERDRSERDR